MSKSVEVMTIPVGDNGPQRVLADDDCTVGQAIKQAGFSTAGYNVTVASNPRADMQTVVAANDKIVLTRQVKSAASPK